MTIYLRQTWEDPRLRFNGTDRIVAQGNILEKIWIPDTYFNHEKKSNFHEITKKNYELSFYPNGTVFLSIRLVVWDSFNKTPPFVHDPSIHPSTHPSIHSSIHPFIRVFSWFPPKFVSFLYCIVLPSSKYYCKSIFRPVIKMLLMARF